MARTHVVLSDELLKVIDNRVGQRGRSRFLEQAAREKLAREALDEALVETAGMLDAEEHPEWRDLEAIRTWVRNMRGAGP